MTPTYAESMTRFVIDPPTLLHIVDTGLDVVARHQLVAPNSIRSAALELVLRDVVEGRRTDQEAREVQDRITERKIRLLGDRVSRSTAWAIAREHGWRSLVDAEYLAVTRLQADALVTVDPRMVALADGVVPLAPVESLLGDP